MPDNTIYVGRPTMWGNPFYTKWPKGQETKLLNPLTPTEAVREYQYMYDNQFSHRRIEVRTKLKGKNLACWCPLNQPCHADVLLKLANLPEGGL